MTVLEEDIVDDCWACHVSNCKENNCTVCNWTGDK